MSFIFYGLGLILLFGLRGISHQGLSKRKSGLVDRVLSRIFALNAMGSCVKLFSVHRGELGGQTQAFSTDPGRVAQFRSTLRSPLQPSARHPPR